VTSSTRHRAAFLVAGAIAASAACLVIAGPASADSTTPPSPLPTSPATPSGVLTALPTAAPSAPVTGPAGPIQVPAGNAKIAAPDDTTAVTLLGAGGVLVAGAGLVAARRRT